MIWEILMLIIGPCIGVAAFLYRKELRERGFYLDRSDMPPKNPFGNPKVFNNKHKE